nr:immunoglobulin heavy chain junction region [Homo sapiens]
LCNRDSILL